MTKNPGPFRRFFAMLGPGVVTGAADDDPSGIVTYTIAGAQLGTALLWTALLTWPLMAAVQYMCARIGMVSGEGLTRALRRCFPRWLLAIMALALFAANAINIGADLSGMAEVLEEATGLKSGFFVLVIGVIIVLAVVRFTYPALASILKWLALVLFAYVITAVVVRPNWKEVLLASFSPHWPRSHNEWETLVAILGTTISPYLFFWQTGQEIEEAKAKGHKTVTSRHGASSQELRDRAVDVGIGTFFSNSIMYFIILTAAVTLNAHGETKIESSRDAIRVLHPLAGDLATLLYAVGLIGVGFLAIPALAGSSAYVLAELFSWREGLDEKFSRARLFYIALIGSVAVGVLFTFSGIKATDALFLTAVINGLLAPFVMIGILVVASHREIMQGQPSSWLARVVVGVTTLGMFVAGVALFF
jgi:NRAMP (natural resistance-associated macrophage protein)-like metal ion transporter